MKSILFSDLDGTLIGTTTGNTFPQGIWDMSLKLYVLDAIKRLDPEVIFIVSNQGGIDQGYVTIEQFSAKINYICKAIEDYCKIPCYSMFCGSMDKDDPYRKPNTKMLEKLAIIRIGDNLKEIKQRSLMIGDASGKEGQYSDTDKRTAENFGIKYLDVNDFIRINDFSELWSKE